MGGLRVYNRLRTVSVCTPWLGHPELIPDYEEAVRNADEVVIVDNGSEPEDSAEIVAMLTRLGYPERHRYLRWRENGWFSGPMNEAIRAATGDVIVALNNDVRNSMPGARWIAAARNEVRGKGLYGPSSARKVIDGVTLPYVEGWCVAANRPTWDRLGGFDAEAFERPYWEDVDLSFRAMTKGIPLYRTDWPIDHLSNTTSAATPGAYEHTEQNRITFETRVREFLSQKEEAHESTPQAASV